MSEPRSTRCLRNDANLPFGEAGIWLRQNNAREATNGKAFDGGGRSSDDSRNELRNCPGLSGKTRHDHRSLAAGGPADITGRIVADIFSRHLNQKSVVENVGGAGGTLGALRAARAAADGYTILSGHLGNGSLYRHGAGVDCNAGRRNRL